MAGKWQKGEGRCGNNKVVVGDLVNTREVHERPQMWKI